MTSAVLFVFLRNAASTWAHRLVLHPCTTPSVVVGCCRFGASTAIDTAWECFQVVGHAPKVIRMDELHRSARQECTRLPYVQLQVRRKVALSAKEEVLRMRSTTVDRRNPGHAPKVIRMDELHRSARQECTRLP